MNILSYQPGTFFTGSEIKEWVQDQIQRQTSHLRAATYVQKRYSNIQDERLYEVYLIPEEHLKVPRVRRITS